MGASVLSYRHHGCYCLRYHDASQVSPKFILNVFHTLVRSITTIANCRTVVLLVGMNWKVKKRFYRHHRFMTYINMYRCNVRVLNTTYRTENQ
jgi:hypothetical protein